MLRHWLYANDTMSLLETPHGTVLKRISAGEIKVCFSLGIDVDRVDVGRHGCDVSSP
jgi:hypothetical protein